jgi:hypothetical protein
MDPINKLTKLLEVLRLQQTNAGSATSKKLASAPGVKQANPHSASAGKIPAKLNLNQLSRRIAERINRLPLEDRQSSKKAVHIFVDSVLAWEFGEDILDTDSFSRYSTKVRETINSNTELTREFNLFIKSLSEN